MLELVIPSREALAEHQTPLNHAKALSFLIDRLYNEAADPARYYVSSAYIRLLLLKVDELMCESPLRREPEIKVINSNRRNQS